MIIFDNHFHLDFAGLGVSAVKDFEKSGGTHILLVHKPFADYETTLKLAELVRKETNVKVFVALGPHPAELTKLLEKLSLDESVEKMKKEIETAGKYVMEKSSVAIGEIGRPHYDVSDDVLEASNRIMEYCMGIAKDVGCPVILHTETATKETFKEIAEMADKVGLKREKVIKHYSPPFVKSEDNFGIFPSILAGKDIIKEAIKTNNRFMMETDYMDDIKRPDAVLGPKTVPRVTKLFLEKNIFTQEDDIKIHKENPERVYGIDVEYIKT
ncbi:MAG: TatD family hydrolase [Candidatus Thermoplasmatota archaeon]|nr:TatD family hydrolase [Candidatus Thermoplasmatota archaeon]